MRYAGLLAAMVLAVGSAACSSKPPKHLVEALLVLEPGDPTGVLGLSRQQLQSLADAKLDAHGGFERLKPDDKRKGQAVRLELLMEPLQEIDAEEKGARVGSTVALLARVPNTERGRYQLFGAGSARIAGAGLDERQEAARRALAIALEDAIALAHARLWAISKKDDALVKDLSDKSAPLQRAAVDELTERRHPAAADALLARLKGTDPAEVRQAIGALVELKEQRAVPALIDLARAKDMMFIREITFALGAIGGDEARAYLYTVAQGHDEDAIRAAAEQALEEMDAAAKLRR